MLLFTARQGRRLRYLLRPTTERVVVIAAMAMVVVFVLILSGRMAGAG